MGYTNAYSYVSDPAKSYDNRWMHRPLIDWEKNKQREKKGTPEQRLFSGTQRLLQIRKSLPLVADQNNHQWLSPHNIQVAGFVRTWPGEKPLYCLFNFSEQPAHLTWYALKEGGLHPELLFDYWTEKEMAVGEDHEYLVLAPYQFCLLEQR